MDFAERKTTPANRKSGDKKNRRAPCNPHQQAVINPAESFINQDMVKSSVPKRTDLSGINHGKTRINRNIGVK
jgi:hypothetical protein